jgi:hypothetical protein
MNERRRSNLRVVSGGADDGPGPTLDELRAQLARVPELTADERADLATSLYLYGIVHTAPRPQYARPGSILWALLLAAFIWAGLIGFVFFIVALVDAWR